MKNLRDTLVFMVGRRVAIAASVCALACVRCSSFSGSDSPPSPEPIADGGPGGTDGTVITPEKDGGITTCETGVTCESSDPPGSCDLTTFEGGGHPSWTLSNTENAKSDEEGYTLFSGDPARESTLGRTTSADKFHLEIDFEVAFNESVELVRVNKLGGHNFFVDVSDAGITLGAVGGMTVQLQQGRTAPAGRLVLDVDPSGLTASLDCGGTVKGPSFTAVTKLQNQVLVGINAPATAGVGIEKSTFAIIHRLFFKEDK